MNLAICILSIIPVRSDQSHRSEMVSQLMYNELCYIMKEENDWRYVQIKENGYEGWIQNGQYKYVHSDQSTLFDSIIGMSQDIIKTAEGSVRLLHGTPVSRELDNANVRQPTILDFEIEFPKLIDYYLNVPYLWGGRSIFGIDCSGLSQIIYRHFGIHILRDAWQQAGEGVVVDFVSEARAGDLAFFDNTDGKITHVGIMVDSQTIFHASSKVRIDKFDSEGILNTDTKQYTHKFRIMKRYF